MENGEVVEEVIDTVPVEVVEDNAALEDRARRQGWKPKDEYRGPPGRWRDAKAYLEHGENEWPVLRERMRELDKRHVERESKWDKEREDLNKRIAETTEVLVEMREMTQRSTEAAYNRGRREVEAKMEQAASQSDMQAYHAAQRELAEIEAVRPKPLEKKVETTVAPPPAAPPVPQVDPEITAWTAQNPWFERDVVLKTYAIDLDSDLMRRFPGMSTTDRLQEVTRQTLTKFPEKFGNPRRAAAPVSGSGSPPVSTKKGKSVEDLPPEAKAALARFKTTIPGYKDEDYLKVYFAGEM